MKKFLMVVLFFTLSARSFAQTLVGSFELKSSKINYLVTYLLKRAEGESSLAKGRGECKKECEFLVAAPLKSFESKDNNRDANMLKATNAEKYPLVVVHVKTPTEIANGEIKADFEIEFAGIKKTYKNIPFKAKITNEELHIDGKFDLVLSLHKIDRPSLLGVEIKDIVPVTIVADWKKL